MNGAVREPVVAPVMNRATAATSLPTESSRLKWSPGLALLVFCLAICPLTAGSRAEGAPVAQADVEREYKLGKGYYDMGLPERAIPHFERVRETQDRRAESALFFLAESYYATTDLEKAAGRYLELVRRFAQTPRKQDALARAGECLVKIDRGEQAVTVLDALLTDPGTHKASALFWKGEALRQTNATDDAIGAYRVMVRSFPNDELAPYALFNLASLLHDSDRSSEALDAIDSLNSYPEAMVSSVRLLAGDAALATDDPSRAASEYAAVQETELRPDALEGIARAARSLERQDLLDLARNELKSIAPQSAQRARADLLAGAWAAEQGQVDLADQCLEPHLSGELGAECQFWRGWARGAADRPADAAAVYRTIADREGDWATWASYRLAAELRSAKEWEEALEVSQRFEQQHPDDPRLPEVVAGAVESAFQLGSDEAVAQITRRFRTKFADHALAPDVLRFASESALRQEEWDGAVEGFEALLAGQVDSETRKAILPRLAWAHFQRDGGESSAAISAILRTLRGFDGVSPAALGEVGLLLGHSHLADGDKNSAQQAFTLTSTLDPDGEAGTKAALEAASLAATGPGGNGGGSLEAQIDAYDEVLARGASGAVRARALLERSELQAAAGRFSEALPGFATFVEENPKHESLGFALLGLAFAQWRLEKLDDAKQALGRLEQAGGFQSGHELRPEALFLRAQVAHAQEQRSEARTDFETYVTDHAGGPRERESLRQLARIAEADERPEDAIAYLQMVREKYGDADDADEALYRLAWLEHEAGRTDDARRHYEWLLDRHPETSYAGDAHYRLADLAYADQAYDRARQHYEAALDTPEVERLGAFARYRIAWSFQHEENWASAFDAFAAMAKAHPASELTGESLFLASESARKLDRDDDERRMLEQFLDRSERHQYTDEASIRLAELLTPEGNWPRIRGLLDPIDASSLSESLGARRHVALGRALVQLGAAQSAMSHFDAALKAGKAIAAEAQFELGNAHRALGDKKRATEVFLSGPILYPFKPWAVRCYLEAGRELAAAGDRDEAKRILKFAVSEGGDGPEAREASKLLSELGGE